MKTQIEGIFNVYKEPGMTSHDVVAAVRRITQVRRVGHGGTLDPFAAGVLPVFVGQATRVIEYLGDERKSYWGDVVLGVSTDTYDVEGSISSIRPVPELSRQDLEDVLARFIGQINQRPPRFSAIKVGGKRLYKYARGGLEVEVPTRTVRIDRILLLDWVSPVLSIRVDCGRGVYIRSLANDIGDSIGCGGYLHSLLRLRSGPFVATDAIGLDSLRDAIELGYWDNVAYPADEVLADWPAVILSQTTTSQIRQGKDWFPRVGRFFAPAGRLRAYTDDGDFAAVLSRIDAEKQWHPEKVFGWN